MLSLATLMACSSPIPQAPRGEGIPDEDALLALEAYRGEGRYFLRYQRGEEIFTADWPAGASRRSSRGGATRSRRRRARGPCWAC